MSLDKETKISSSDSAIINTDQGTDQGTVQISEQSSDQSNGFNQDPSKNTTPHFVSSKKRILGSAGPFQVIDSVQVEVAKQESYNHTSELDHPPEGPRRRYDCWSYENCLKVAAALNWDSFTCRGCCGDINEKLLWRAQHEVRKDQTAKIICGLPDVRRRKIENSSLISGLKLVAGKGQ